MLHVGNSRQHGNITLLQAAHIHPVADRGPDSVRNGLALSAPCTGCSTVA
ncbi:HNH endonuclease [Agrobacterium salinitolerans]